MVQLIEDVPNTADARRRSLIHQQLQGYSQSIAALFGDNIPSLQSMIRTRGKGYADLRVKLAIERTSTKTEKSRLEDRLNQTIDHYVAALQKKEAESRQKLTELTAVITGERVQAEKAESDLTAASLTSAEPRCHSAQWKDLS